MSEIDLNMPGGRYQYPSTSKDETFMSTIGEMTKEFEAAGAQEAQSVQPQQPVPQQSVRPPAPASAPAPAQATPLIDGLPVEPPTPEQKKKKQAPKPAPSAEPKKQATLDDVKANFETDVNNLKLDFEDMVRILNENAAKTADPAEIEELKTRIEAQDKIIAEQEQSIAKLKKALAALTE